MSDATATGRIATLDILRGVAVMGIFAMNIVNFAMPDAAYINPAAYGTGGAADLFAWAASFVLIDGKMRGLFSVLFGASMLLVIEGAEARSESGLSLHLRRMAWLLVLGLLHFVLVWDGDILTHYAVIGAVAYALRRKTQRALLVWAGLLLLVQLIFMTGVAASYVFAEAAANAPGASAQAVAQWRDMGSGIGVPDVATLSNDLALNRGTYGGMVADRLANLPGDPLSGLLVFGLETLAYMLGGMWGLRSGFLAGAWPRARYVRIAAVCLSIGLAAYAGLALFYYQSGFRASYVFGVVFAATTLVRPIVIVGLAALIILLTANGGALVARIAAAGRAAFTNYLGASLIATTIFYGHGLGLFGRLSRWELYPLVFAVWMVMLLWSKPWLDRYRYGPFEWLWRSLSRGALQPTRA